MRLEGQDSGVETEQKGPKMLESVVTDKNLAWEAKDIRPEEFTVLLRMGSLMDLVKNRELLQLPTSKFSANSHNSALFPLLTMEIHRLCREYLDQGKGMLVISGASFDQFSELEQRNVNWLISNILGKTIAQNEKGDMYVAVKDTGKRMSEGGRYHQSNEGGELHTDSPQYPVPPEYVGLHCIHTGMQGGESRMISAYSVHNALLKDHADVLPELYGPFHIEQRGTDPAKTTYKPVFTYGKEGLSMRYLASYMRSGHEKMKQPLTEKQAKAMEVVDTLLADPKLVADFMLNEGDMFFFHNMRIVHGRTTFQDDLTKVIPPREMGRVWIEKKA